MHVLEIIDSDNRKNHNVLSAKIWFFGSFSFCFCFFFIFLHLLSPRQRAWPRIGSFPTKPSRNFKFSPSFPSADWFTSTMFQLLCKLWNLQEKHIKWTMWFFACGGIRCPVNWNKNVHLAAVKWSSMFCLIVIIAYQYARERKSHLSVLTSCVQRAGTYSNTLYQWAEYVQDLFCCVVAYTPAVVQFWNEKLFQQSRRLHVISCLFNSSLYSAV